jgi:hypothetical protein
MAETPGIRYQLARMLALVLACAGAEEGRR